MDVAVDQFLNSLFTYIALGLMRVSCCTGLFVLNTKLGPSYIIFALQGQWPRKVVNLQTGMFILSFGFKNWESYIFLHFNKLELCFWAVKSL